MNLKTFLLATLIPCTMAATTLAPIDSTSRGWLSDNSGNTITPGLSANFLAGALDGDGYRDFFRFTLPTFTGSVTAADLQLDEPANGSLFPTGVSTFTFNIYKLAALFAYDDIGANTLFGTVTLSASDDGTTVHVALNSDALIALTSGATVTFGGVLALPNNDDDAQFFAHSGAGESSILQLTTGDIVVGAPAPEPASALFIAAGLVGMGWILRKRKMA